MKRALVLLVCAICAICATTCSVEAASSFYVSPSGNDANPGTFAAPFQTLARASAAVRTINQQMNSDVTVYLRGGVYALDAPWTLTQEDSGFNGFNVIYTAYTAETPIVSGGVQVRNWKLYNESLNIWVADTSDLFESTRQIYVDDVRMPRCYRGNGILGNVTITDTGYLTDATDLLDVADPSTIEFVYTGSGTSWTEARCGVESITALPKGAGTNITMKQPCFAIGRNRPGGQGFNVPTSMENAFEFCTSNGMWFHDEEQQLLFYIPADGGNVTSNTGVVVPTIEVLLEVVGTVGESSVDRVHNIQFQNIHFEHAGWTFPSSGFGYVDIQGGVMLLDPYATATNGTQTPANVRVEAGQQIVFDGCTFRHLGASGLAITNSSQFNLVTNCIFTDISAAGVQIGIINDHTETRPEFFHSYNNVTNCLFFDLPVEYRGNVVLFGGYLVSSEFSHNEISDAPYAAINLGWGWSRAPGYSSNNIVNYNKLFNYMRVLIDGGGVYTLGPQPTSEVGFNYLFSQHHLFGSLYHDEGSGNFWTHDNVVSNSPEWLHIWTGSIFDINVANCYTDQTFMTFAGTNCTLVNTTYVTNGDWPAGALEIMANAGVSSSMLHRKAKLLARSAKSPVAPRAPVNPEWSLSMASGFESYDRRGRWVDPKLFSTC